MGPTQVNGLPAHVLLVHLAVTLIPFAAALVVASACWPMARRRLGIITPLVALLALGLVPIVQNAGNWLLPRIRFTPLVARHQQLGNTLLPWVAALAGVAVVTWVVHTLQRRAARSRTDDDPPADSRRSAPMIAVSVALGVLAIVVSAGTVLQTYRIGESGSRAVWTGNFTTQPGGPP